MPLTARRPSQDLVDLVGALGGEWHGPMAMVRCPAHDDREPSLSLRQGDRGILVNCFAGCDPTDILLELRRVKSTGTHRPPPEWHPRGTPNVARLWDMAVPVEGTIAAAYLAYRHLPLGLADLRYLARCPLGPAKRAVFRPAMLVAVREGRALRAIQRIFLAPGGHGYEQKLMLGRPGQGAWQDGPVGLTLAIAEGFETAAAFATLSGLPCWASLGAKRLHQLRLPPTITRLVIARDNDPEGQRAANRAAEAYARPGLIIRQAPPPAPDKDWAKRLEAR
jgi:hypothetical protein